MSVGKLPKSTVAAAVKSSPKKATAKKVSSKADGTLLSVVIRRRIEA